MERLGLACRFSDLLSCRLPRIETGVGSSPFTVIHLQLSFRSDVLGARERRHMARVSIREKPSVLTDKGYRIRR